MVVSEYSKFVGEKIRKAREKRKLSLEDVAGCLGKSPSYLSSIERGDHSPSIDYVERVAFALGVKIEKLLCKEEDELQLQEMSRRNRLLESIDGRFDRLPFRKQQCMLNIIDNLFRWGEGDDDFPEAEQIEESMVRYTETRIDQRQVWEITEGNYENENGPYVSYGIAVYRVEDRKKILLEQIDDIHTNKNVVIRLRDEMQIGDLSVEHFHEVVKDFVENNYRLLISEDDCMRV